MTFHPDPPRGDPRQDEEALSFGARERGTPQRRVVLGGLVLALVLGAGIGIAVFRSVSDPRPARTVTATPSRSVGPSGPSGAQALQATAGRCAQQRGRDLQLGVELANVSGLPVTLLSVDADAPIGGLQLTTLAVGTCGSLTRGRSPDGLRVAAGAKLWVVGTFLVDFDHCPAPDPVDLVVAFRSSGHNEVSRINAFPDLGGVPYSQCRTPSS